MQESTRQIIKATSTPLASIFGSGFLVIVPILAGAVGPYSVLAMATVCGLAYAVGTVIRHNIRTAEPLLEAGKAPRSALVLERTSDVTLVVAYVISVCLYLRILSAFLLGGLGMDSDFHEQLLTTGIVVVIAIISVTKGLQALERLEDIALWVTIAIIAALFAGFASFDLKASAGAGIQWPPMPQVSGWQMLTVVAGTLIVVQGFETSRYLGAEYDQETRVRSCRYSQIISAAVYLAFVALATPLMHFLGARAADNALIMLAGKASALLVAPLVIAAVLSQFSAAVADTLGGSGNTEEASGKRISEKLASLVICAGAIVLAWSASTLEILAIASRAFALYYMLQCLVAFSVATDPVKRFCMLAVAAALAFIAIFAVPAG